MNVRIARQDGTFFVRDDLPDTPENKVFQGEIVIGLFGEQAPNHVKRFLSYVDRIAVDENEAPMPNYSRSVFSSYDDASGLVRGGTIPGLEYTELNASPVLQYGGRILPASLWIDTPSSRLSHVGKGLLTHRNLDALPTFGITTRTDTTELDRSHTVFGKILPDDSSTDFLRRIQDLPVYAVDRSLVDDDDIVKETVFNAQRDFFRKAAKSLGDTRVSKLYPGKLLRRVEVTNVQRV